MTPDSPLSAVARVIQLSVAPVFLLTSLGTILGVLSTRLGRIVDRARALERTPAASGSREQEIRSLVRRRHLVNTAMTLATTAALLVCVLIASAFVGSIVHADFSHLVAALFIAAMIAFMGALVTFLGEVLLAVRSVRIGIDR